MAVLSKEKNYDENGNEIKTPQQNGQVAKPPAIVGGSAGPSKSHPRTPSSGSEGAAPKQTRPPVSKEAPKLVAKTVGGTIRKFASGSARKKAVRRISTFGPPLGSLPPLPIHTRAPKELMYNPHQPQQPAIIWYDRVKLLRLYTDDLRILFHLGKIDLLLITNLLASIAVDTKEHTSAYFMMMRAWAAAKKSVVHHALTVFEVYGTIPVNTVPVEERSFYWPFFGEYDEIELAFVPAMPPPDMSVRYPTETKEAEDGWKEILGLGLHELLEPAADDETRLSTSPSSSGDSKRAADVGSFCPLLKSRRGNREPPKPDLELARLWSPKKTQKGIAPLAKIFERPGEKNVVDSADVPVANSKEVDDGSETTAVDQQNAEIEQQNAEIEKQDE